VTPAEGKKGRQPTGAALPTTVTGLLAYIVSTKGHTDQAIRLIRAITIGVISVLVVAGVVLIACGHPGGGLAMLGGTLGSSVLGILGRKGWNAVTGHSTTKGAVAELPPQLRSVDAEPPKAA
jgi:hypothetical protein